MKIKYFEDTDTALLEFSDHPVFETKEINENIYLDLDEEGNLIGMTIEHALSQANISEVSFQQINRQIAQKAD
ncbi:MAG: DUF2283 domain-containing protein [Methylococcales bacterium]|nr:DUF2283 domain-containing protein [Methylococcales bacterium]